MPGLPSSPLSPLSPSRPEGPRGPLIGSRTGNRGLTASCLQLISSSQTPPTSGVTSRSRPCRPRDDDNNVLDDDVMFDPTSRHVTSVVANRNHVTTPSSKYVSIKLRMRLFGVSPVILMNCCAEPFFFEPVQFNLILFNLHNLFEIFWLLILYFCVLLFFFFFCS